MFLDLLLGLQHGGQAFLVGEVAVPDLVGRIDDVHRIHVDHDLEVAQRDDATIVDRLQAVVGSLRCEEADDGIQDRAEKEPAQSGEEARADGHVKSGQGMNDQP